jgi:hypothetical protein
MPALPCAARVLLLIGLLPLVSVGCGPTRSDPTPQPEPIAAADPSASASEEPGEAAPVIASDEPVFDFGTISPTEQVTHVFKIVNRGSADLKIERVERT